MALPSVKIFVMTGDKKIRLKFKGRIVATVDPKTSAARQRHLYRLLAGELEKAGRWLEEPIPPRLSKSKL